MADLRGTPPHDPKLSQFRTIYQTILHNHMLVNPSPPPRFGVPSYGESWVYLWNVTHVSHSFPSCRPYRPSCIRRHMNVATWTHGRWKRFYRCRRQRHIQHRPSTLRCRHQVEVRAYPHVKFEGIVPLCNRRATASCGYAPMLLLYTNFWLKW